MARPEYERGDVIGAQRYPVHLSAKRVAPFTPSGSNLIQKPAGIEGGNVGTAAGADDTAGPNC
jgi:hypothetical protein